MPLDLHFLVRDAYRRAMAERRAESEAHDLALALVLARWPQTMAHARRLVAVTLATEPALFWDFARSRETDMDDFIAQLEAEIPRLRRYACALTRDPGQADDLVQSCLVRALANENRWQPASDLRAWLFTILHNVHVSDQRRTTRDLRRSGMVVSYSPAHCEPRNVPDFVDLDRAIARLPDPQRRVLLLIGLEEMSYEQAAAVLSLPVGTVRSRLGRARATLRRLTGHGTGTPTAGAGNRKNRHPERAARFGEERPAAA